MQMWRFWNHRQYQQPQDQLKWLKHQTRIILFTHLLAGYKSIKQRGIYSQSNGLARIQSHLLLLFCFHLLHYKQTCIYVRHWLHVGLLRFINLIKRYVRFNECANEQHSFLVTHRYNVISQNNGTGCVTKRVMLLQSFLTLEHNLCTLRYSDSAKIIVSLMDVHRVGQKKNKNGQTLPI